MVTFMPVEKLTAHEETNPQRLLEVRTDIAERGILKLPLLVDRVSGIILDGHHRFQALRDLGKKTVPVRLVNYRSSAIQVFPRRCDIPVTKEIVLATGRAHQLFPEKTTRHVMRSKQRIANVPLQTFN